MYNFFIPSEFYRSVLFNNNYAKLIKPIKQDSFNYFYFKTNMIYCENYIFSYNKQHNFLNEFIWCK